MAEGSRKGVILMVIGVVLFVPITLYYVFARGILAITPLSTIGIVLFAIGLWLFLKAPRR